MVSMLLVSYASGASGASGKDEKEMKKTEHAIHGPRPTAHGYTPPLLLFSGKRVKPPAESGYQYFPFRQHSVSSLGKNTRLTPSYPSSSYLLSRIQLLGVIYID
jgi:hypothetical protein